MIPATCEVMQAWSAEADVCEDVLEAIRRNTAVAAPRECCGVLLGRIRSRSTRVEAIEPIENAATTDRRYAIGAGEVLRVQRRWERAGLDVVGFYHSHPHGDAVPSAIDVIHSVPGYLYLIAAGEVRGWRTAAPGAPLREVRLRRAGGA